MFEQAGSSQLLAAPLETKRLNLGVCLVALEFAMTQIRRNAVLVTLALLVPVAALAQQNTSGESAAASQGVSVREQVTSGREKLSVELAATKAAIESAIAEGQEAPEALKQELELLGRLDRLYGQILAALDHEAELKASKEKLTVDLDNLRAHGPTEPKPYPFRLLENFRDQLETETARGETRSDAIEAGLAAVVGAKTALEQKERNRRQAKEAIESNKDATRTPSLRIALRTAQIDSRVAAEEVRLREIDLENQKLESELRDLQLTSLREKIDYVAKGLRFRQQGLDEYLAQIDQAEFRLNQTLEWAQADFSARDTEWIEARRRLEASLSKDQNLVEEFEARQLARRSRQREVALIGEQLQALSDTRTVWNRRFQIFNETVDDTTVEQWAAEARRALDQISRDVRINSARLTELRGETITLDSEINASGDASPEVRSWLEQQKHHLDAMIGTYEATIDQLESARRLHDRLLSEIATQVATVTWSELATSIWRKVVDVWNYEITAIQDNPITVRKIVIGVVLLLVGILVARFVTGWLGRRLLSRVGLNEGAVAAIQSLLFYLLVLTVVMLSLRIVNVPLTAFTILGGALAIGIGFGSQNIVNNFISGLILLAERPIRKGDLVQLDDLVGVIEHIGPRSTRVRSPENVDIVVPNSSFLEKNVINWTLTDDRYRAHVSVGVIYGSPTRDVVKLIRKALDEHGKVLPKPEPIVLFADFGDNALIFEAHFWVRMRRIMDRRLIESDIRSRVDSLFREAGIVVAFPQRDVHLDSHTPIQVEVLQQAETDRSAGLKAPSAPDERPNNDAKT